MYNHFEKSKFTGYCDSLTVYLLSWITLFDIYLFFTT